MSDLCRCVILHIIMKIKSWGRYVFTLYKCKIQNDMPKKKIKQGWFFKIEKSFRFLLMYYWLAFIKKIKQGWFFIFEKSFRLWNTNVLLVSVWLIGCLNKYTYSTCMYFVYFNISYSLFYKYIVYCIQVNTPILVPSYDYITEAL